MAAKSFKLEYALIGRYQQLFEEKYNRQPVVNKYKEKWAASSLIEDFGYDCAIECLQYYFKTTKDGHPISYFFFNFEQLKDMLDSQKRDQALREERRQKTQDLVREYLNGV